MLAGSRASVHAHGMVTIVEDGRHGMVCNGRMVVMLMALAVYHARWKSPVASSGLPNGADRAVTGSRLLSGRLPWDEDQTVRS